MARDIETYLKELQAALAAAAADPALVQDALFDAEEYLQAEMAIGGVVGRGTATYEDRLAAVVEKWGTPGEVAAAYLGESGLVTAPAAPGTVPEEAPLPEVEAVEAGVAAGTEGSGGEVMAEALPAGEAPSGAGRPAPGAAAPQFCRHCGRSLRPGSGFCAACGAPVAGEGAAGTAPAAAPPVGVQAGMAAAAAGAGAPPTFWRQVFGVFADPAVYKALVYMILALATGVAYFTIVVTGISTTGGLLVMIIGIPLFLLFLGAVRGLSLFEGRLVEWLLGARMPRRLRAEPPNAGILQRIMFWLKDGRTWASMAYMVLMLPLGTAYFTIAVTGLAVGAALLVSPLWVWTGWATDRTFVYDGVVYQWDLPGWAAPFGVLAGALLLIGMMHLIKWIGRGHAAFAKAMLVRLP